MPGWERRGCARTLSVRIPFSVCISSGDLPAAGYPAAGISSFRNLFLFSRFLLTADVRQICYFRTRLLLSKKRTASTAAAARKIPRYSHTGVSSPVFTEDCGT